MQIDPARNGGVFCLVFAMSVGYVKSDFEFQNLRLWQAIYNLDLLNQHNTSANSQTIISHIPSFSYKFLHKLKIIPS
jgi:hypothetical protein